MCMLIFKHSLLKTLSQVITTSARTVPQELLDNYETSGRNSRFIREVGVVEKQTGLPAQIRQWLEDLAAFLNSFSHHSPLKHSLLRSFKGEKYWVSLFSNWMYKRSEQPLQNLGQTHKMLINSSVKMTRTQSFPLQMWLQKPHPHMPTHTQTHMQPIQTPLWASSQMIHLRSDVVNNDQCFCVCSDSALTATWDDQQVFFIPTIFPDVAD